VVQWQSGVLPPYATPCDWILNNDIFSLKVAGINMSYFLYTCFISVGQHQVAQGQSGVLSAHAAPCDWIMPFLATRWQGRTLCYNFFLTFCFIWSWIASSGTKTVRSSRPVLAYVALCCWIMSIFTTRWQGQTLFIIFSWHLYYLQLDSIKWYKKSKEFYRHRNNYAIE
jgi:hypothetical protein